MGLLSRPTHVTESAKKAGLSVVREREIPGTTRILDLSRYLDQGYRLVTF